MDIRILEFVDGAKQAEGVTVVIDVFRAFSVECYAYNAGVKMIIATNDVDKAFELGRQYQGAILAGERKERKVEGFDIGNSPTEVLNTDIKEKVFVHTTSAGTNGLLNATNADVLLTGSLVNCSAITRYIKSLHPSVVSLVAMGFRAEISAAEDLLCAQIIKDGLLNQSRDYTAEIEDLKNTSGARFFLPENLEITPPSDYFYCIMKDRFDFVLKAEKREDGNLLITKV